MEKLEKNLNDELFVACVDRGEWLRAFSLRVRYDETCKSWMATPGRATKGGFVAEPCNVPVPIGADAPDLWSQAVRIVELLELRYERGEIRPIRVCKVHEDSVCFSCGFPASYFRDWRDEWVTGKARFLYFSAASGSHGAWFLIDEGGREISVDARDWPTAPVIAGQPYRLRFAEAFGHERRLVEIGSVVG